MDADLIYKRSYTKKPDANHFYMHAHDRYEIFCFLQGDAKYYIEGKIYTLKPRDILMIKKNEAHSLLINSQVPYERIVIEFYPDALINRESKMRLSYFDGLALGEGNKYPSAIFKDKNWQYYIDRILNGDGYCKRLYLTVLVNELYECSPTVLKLQTEKDGFSDIINYLNEHIYEPLSLDSLCERFYTSKSCLNRKFKLMTGSTVWKYITAKRLLYAKELLQNGIPPTKVFSKCGFNDYTSFYRAYKIKFGTPPKFDLRLSKKSVNHKQIVF